MAEQMTLNLAMPPVYAVHCIFCSATVRAGDPDRAHDDMERHYADRHRRQIDRIVGAAPCSSPTQATAPRRTRIVLGDGWPGPVRRVVRRP